MGGGGGFAPFPPPLNYDGGLCNELALIQVVEAADQKPYGYPCNTYNVIPPGGDLRF